MTIAMTAVIAAGVGAFALWRRRHARREVAIAARLRRRYLRHHSA